MIIITEVWLKMDKDENEDDEVWNASAVILDIDSGAPRVTVGDTFLSAEMIMNGRSQFFNFIIHLSHRRHEMNGNM